MGGVLLLSRAWAILGGDGIAAAGVRWQGMGGSLLLWGLIVLPVLGAGSVRAVATQTGVQTDALWRVLGWSAVLTQRRLARFASSPRHDWVAVLRAMARALAAHAGLGDEARIIAVDSTTVEKRYGRQMPGRRPVYDAVQKRLVDGYELVSAVVVGPARWWPVGMLPHHKAATAAERAALKRRRRKASPGEMPSKLDLTLQLVAQAIVAGVGAPTVVGDSAFCVTWWLHEIAALGRHWLVGTRQDRRLRIGAELRVFREWASTAPLTETSRDPNGTSLWGTLLPPATLLDRHCARRGLRCRPAYLERRNRAGQVIHRWYLLSSQLDWDLATLWQHWTWRWKIEVFHRTSKQHLHLTDVHVRSWSAIVAWVACSSLRVSLLAFVQAIDPACQTLSTEALIDRLTHASVIVHTRSDTAIDVYLPRTLPATTLWTHPAPFPRYWPANLCAA